MNKSGLRLLFALVSGACFGAGLAWSDMINPARVLGFLTIAPGWDPTLAFVMTGALIVSVPGFYLILKRRAPVCDDRFFMPTLTEIDRKLLGGAAVFGLGWGLVGLCPGPALVSLLTGRWEVILFVLAMLSGMFVHDRVVAAGR